MPDRSHDPRYSTSGAKPRTPPNKTLRSIALGLGASAVALTGLVLWLAPRPEPTSTTLKPSLGERRNLEQETVPLDRAGLSGNERPQTMQGPADPLEVQRKAPEAYDVETPEELYLAACGSCHMADGRGAQGAGAYPALAGNPKVQRPEFVAHYILAGVGGMPSFRNDLTDEQIATVINYVRQELNNYPDTVNPASIRPLRVPSDVSDINGEAG